MRKILMFGTMLGVAGTALAFGGVFSHGSKSTTYKGGVDAIGVHFGGEKKTADSQPEETCPTEKQCGDYCCQGDNVCKQDPDSGEFQCCSEELNYCCPNDQTAVRQPWGPSACCIGKLYCLFEDSDGNCTNNNGCCKDGQIYVLSKLSYGTSYGCCQGTVHKELGLDGADLCCDEGTAPICADYAEGEDCLIYTCCTADEQPYCAARSENGDCYHAMCCAGAIYPALDSNGSDTCCETGNVVEDPDGKKFCCPEGATSFYMGSCIYGTGS